MMSVPHRIHLWVFTTCYGDSFTFFISGWCSYLTRNTHAGLYRRVREIALFMMFVPLRKHLWALTTCYGDSFHLCPIPVLVQKCIWEIFFQVDLLTFHPCGTLHRSHGNTSAVKNDVFWDVSPCGSCMNRRFGGTYRLLHQGDKNRWTRNNASCN
jgi:hypothetical protein